MKCNHCGHIDISEINTDYNVPYTAGYNNSGTVIYIDSRLPEIFIDSQGQKVDVHKYLIIHEVAEKALKDELKLDYNTAHSLAMATQAQALTRDKINYDEYYGFLQKYVNYDIQPEDFEN